MLFFKFSIALVCLSLLIFTIESQPFYLHHFCPNTSTNPRNSRFQTNLNVLLSSLPSIQTPNNTSYNRPYNASLQNLLHDASCNSTPIYSLHNVTVDLVLYDGFFFATAGLELTNKVYFQYICRGDVTTSACQDYSTVATADAIQRCPNETEVMVWYDECFIRYSNLSFFSTADTSPKMFMWNMQSISKTDRFNELLGATVNDAATQASNVPKRFATKKANVTAFQTLYNLVQCAPDLTTLDCDRCLRDAISTLPTCCGGKQGGIILGPSCYIQYQVYPFYNETVTAAPEQPPVILPPPPSGYVARPKGKVDLTFMAPVGLN